MAPNPEGGTLLWGEGPAGNEMPNMEDDRRAERMEREAPWHMEATGEDEIFIGTQNVLCRVWEVRKAGTYYAYVP